jgi:hypothetical protein
LPHREQVAPGVFAAGFSDKFASANCGWIALKDQSLLVDLPRGIAVPDFLSLVLATTGKPARTLMLTHAQNGDAAVVQSLVEKGITRVLASPETRASLLAASKGTGNSLIVERVDQKKNR